jgi:hypothetical protein
VRQLLVPVVSVEDEISVIQVRSFGERSDPGGEHVDTDPVCLCAPISERPTGRERKRQPKRGVADSTPTMCSKLDEGEEA